LVGAGDDGNVYMWDLYTVLLCPNTCVQRGCPVSQVYFSKTCDGVDEELLIAVNKEEVRYYTMRIGQDLAMVQLKTSGICVFSSYKAWK